MFGKWHVGFKSFNHLPTSRGFATAVGSLQTGGPYAGPGHTTRWQNDHPLFHDAQFTNKPPGCNATCSALPCGPPDAAQLPADHVVPALPVHLRLACNATVREGTKMPCGSAIKFTASATVDDCCADCSATPGCTHWVLEPGSESSCHVKGGASSCGESGSSPSLLAAKPNHAATESVIEPAGLSLQASIKKA